MKYIISFIFLILLSCKNNSKNIIIKDTLSYPNMVYVVDTNQILKDKIIIDSLTNKCLKYKDNNNKLRDSFQFYKQIANDLSRYIGIVGKDHSQVVFIVGWRNRVYLHHP